MSQSILRTDPTLLVCRPDKQRNVIGKTGCLGVAAVNTASLADIHYTQTLLNTSNAALRPLKALSSLSCLFLSDFHSSLHKCPPLQTLFSPSHALSGNSVPSHWISPSFWFVMTSVEIIHSIGKPVVFPSVGLDGDVLLQSRDFFLLWAKTRH